MYRKLIMSLTPLLAAAVFAVIPAAAQGAVWEHCVKGTGTEEFNSHQCNVKAAGGGWIWQVIPEVPQTKEQIKFAGRLTLNVAGVQKITCYAHGKGVIWNENKQGHNEITQFLNTQCKGEPECKPVSAVPENLPYHSILLQGPPITDEITGIKVHINCNVLLSAFSGTLKPEISTENGAATFTKASGILKDPEGHEGVVEGKIQVEQESGWAVRVHA